DFLGMHGGLRPDSGFGIPENRTPVSKIGDKSPGGNFPGDRFPGGKFPSGKDGSKIAGKFPDNRPLNPDRRPSRDRPINIGNQINNNINVRPTWANIDKNQLTFNNYLNNHPDRQKYWNNWGNGVRDHWNNYHDHDRWFNQSWWENHN